MADAVPAVTAVPGVTGVTGVTAGGALDATLAEHWDDLSTAALLGTNRSRGVPQPPPGVLADLCEQLASVDPAADVLAQVAALSSARRAGVRPGPMASALVACPSDTRAVCPPRVAARLADVLDQWPDLVDDWLHGVAMRDWRLPPELAVGLLQRFRGDAVRRPAIVALSGPFADWITNLFPALHPPIRRATPAPAVVDLEAMIPAELGALRSIDDPPALAVALAAMIERGTLANRHRSPLIIFVRHLPPPFLTPLAEALARAGSNPNTMGLALSIADLATFRHTMLTELTASSSEIAKPSSSDRARTSAESPSV